METMDMKEHKTDGGTASRLDGFPSNHIERGLARITAVLDAMDLRIESPVFTVGGTNGKGSTCAMLEAILGAAGYHVGCYTSPHLLDVTERIRLQGRPVSSRDHVTAIERVEAARERTSLTYFELMTLAALEVFTSKKVDVLILEVGLGGRLDAVNAVDADCAILTNVALDHTELLGTTREQIGLEKAGIMRRQRPAVCGDPDPPQSVRRYARDAGADLRCVGESYSFQASEDMWHFAGAEGSHLALPYPALVGAHQLGNAAAAIAA